MSGVSVVIKCFNEEHKIDAAIRSALRVRSELGPIQYEVVVADGFSNDRTLERAVRWARSGPVRVMQLNSAEDRGCGAGVELGFQGAVGDLVLFMDGDMVVQRGFLRRATQYMSSHPRCAGVAGLVVDESIRNATDHIRARQGLNRTVGAQPWLNGGGLYRREAIEAAGGYAGDARLAAFEEADLGLRLERAGWYLHRLDSPSMLHQGHALSGWRVLMLRWRGGRFHAAGALLKLHGAKRNGWRVWRMLAHPILLAAACAAMLLAGLLAFASHSIVPVHWVSATFGAFAVAHLGIKRDIRHVLIAWMDWYMLMFGIIAGILRPLPAAATRLSHRVVADGTLRPPGVWCTDRPNRIEKATSP